MLINEIIKGIKEAPQGLNRKEKTKDDIRDGSTLSVNGRTYEWDKTNNAWYSHNDGDYVRPGSESDYRLTMQRLIAKVQSIGAVSTETACCKR